MGRLWDLGVSWPNPAAEADAGCHTGHARGSTVLQRPPQLNFAFGHWKIDATGMLLEKVVAWVVLGFVWFSVPEPAVAAIAAGRHTGFAA